MPQKPGVESTSKRAGAYQRNRPRVVAPAPQRLRCERVEVDPERVLWHDLAGDLFEDRELTQATGLAIVRVARDGASYERVEEYELDDADGTLHWNASGEMFADAELTVPLGLAVVRLVS